MLSIKKDKINSAREMSIPPKASRVLKKLAEITGLELEFNNFRGFCHVVPQKKAWSILASYIGNVTLADQGMRR